MVFDETKRFITELYGDEREESLADKLFNRRYNQLPTIKPSPSDSSMGELIGYVYKDNYKILKEPIGIYKNPKSLTNFGNDTRAVLTNKNDLYVGRSYDALHTFILELLVTKGILSNDSIVNYMQELPEEFITLRRAGNTNTFELARYRTNSEEYNIKLPRYYLMMLDQANSKFPFKFNDNTENISEIIDPNNMIGNIPNQHLDGMPEYDHGILY